MKFKISNTTNDTLLVGYYFASVKNMYVLDTIVLKNGVGEFRNDTLQSGMYFLFNNKKKYDLLLNSTDHVVISCKMQDWFSSVKIEGSQAANGFMEYMQFINCKKELAKKDSTQVKKIGAEVDSYLRKKTAENRENIFGKFLAFLQPVQIKEGTPEEKYRYFKNHFFDNANIFDAALLYTPLYEDKLNEYCNYLVGSPSEINRDIDSLLTRAMTDKKIFRLVLVNTFQHYLKSNQVIAENIWVHLADKWYLPYGDWLDLATREKLKYQVKVRKPNLIGCKAPDFALTFIDKTGFLKAKVDTATRKDVYQGTETKLSKILDSNYTLLIFFEADCSHCKEQMPKFWDVYQKHKSDGLKAIIVHNNNTPEGKVMWCDYINKNQMYDWVNAWSPYSNEYRNLYNIESTPTVYLLHNGMIELKNIDAKTIDQYMTGKVTKLQYHAADK
jgi:thiol-disulfide isomerase/thioredoxin